MKDRKYGLGWIFSKMKGVRFLLAICVTLVLAETVLTLAIAFFLRAFVDIATGHSTLDLLTVGLVAIAVTILSGIISMVLSIMKQYVIGKTERGLRVELMSVILTRRAEHITKQHTGELLTRLTADVTAVSSVFMGIIRNIVGGLASVVFATAAIFFLHWQMAIIMLVLTPVLMFVMSIFTTPMKKASVKDLRNEEGTVELKHESGVVIGDGIMAQIAYVPPVDYLFSGTVISNIIMSEDTVRTSDLESAAADANILDFIQSLPEGFNTQITESGGNVSSGQAQRIAIARAIYKRSPVIVFDEPTANLDAVSIEKFQSAVKRLAEKDKICIIVTHDISTIDICNKVYVIEGGRLRVKLADEKLIFDERDNHDISHIAHAV